MSERVFAVVGLFDSAQALVDAVPMVRAKTRARLQAYTPYPVHGLEEVLELPPSPLGKIVLAMGLLGCASALLMEWWMSAVDYPLRIGGKAFFSWQAFIPVMFEVTVLFAAFTSGLGMLHLLNKLPYFGHPLLKSKAIAAITRDRFALSVEAPAEGFDVEAAKRALAEAGGSAIEVLTLDDAPAGDPLLAPSKVLAFTLACAVAGYGTYWAVKLYPTLPPINRASVQPKLNPEQPEAFFKDGRGMRMPVAGTVARGHMPLGAATAEEAGAVLSNPLPVSQDVLARGKTKYETHCQVCHGPIGDGQPLLSKAYGAKPANLQSQTIMDYGDGQIFYVITNGKNSMPAYGADISPDDRWAIVRYVRALQRSQHAKEGDLP